MSIEVRIRGPGGTLCILWAEPTWVFRDLKSAVGNALDLHLSCFKLFKDTTALRSAKFLSSLPPRSSVDLTLIRQQEIADGKVVMQAIRVSGYAMRTAAPELKADREFVFAALARDHRAFHYAAPELKADRAFVLAAVARNSCAFQYAAPELKADREFVLAAVEKDWHAFQYAAPELKADREFVLAAVAKDCQAFQYAAPELKADQTAGGSCGSESVSPIAGGTVFAKDE
jgi:hypothetical protein